MHSVFKIFNIPLLTIVGCIFLLFLFTANTAEALTQETERRMNIGLNLFPNIISVDTHIKNKLDKSDSLKILFVIRSKKQKGQDLLQRFIKKVKTIRKITIKTQLISLSDFLAEQLAVPLPNKNNESFVSALFVVEPLPDSELRALIDAAVKLHIMVFSPFKGDIERGVTAGLFVGSKIRPYLNMHTITRSNITFHPLFLKLARKYE